MVEGFREVQVGFTAVEVKMVAGGARGVNYMPRLLPYPPVGQAIASLDLV